MTATEVIEDKRTVDAIGDFAALVTGMSRFLIGVANIAPFKEGNLGLAEWLALSVLLEKDGANSKQLARHLGVTGHRANEIAASLKEAELISIVQAEKDSRALIKVTATGKSKVEDMNGQLAPFIATALKDKKPALRNANRQLKILTRIAEPADPEREKRREAKKAAKAQKEIAESEKQ